MLNPSILILNDYHIHAGAETVYRNSIEAFAGKYNVAFFAPVYKKSAHSRHKIFNISAAFKVAWLAHKNASEIILIHNYIEQLTVATLYACYLWKFFRNKKCKIVHVIHDYALASPSRANYYFTDRTSIVNFSPFDSLIFKLSKQLSPMSRSRDLMMKIRWVVLKILFKTDLVDIYVAPSSFMAEFMTAALKIKKVYFCPNPVLPGPISDYLPYFKNKQNLINDTIKIGFFGRPALEKGLGSFINEINASSVKYKLYIYSDPRFIEPATYELIQSSAGHVLLMGHIEHSRVHDVMAQMDFVIVPSLWYENAPMVVIESVSSGTKVVARSIGSLKSFGKETTMVFCYDTPDDLNKILTSKSARSTDLGLVMNALNQYTYSNFAEEIARLV